MTTNNPASTRSATSFALAAAVAVLFNTVLACVKDANVPFKLFLASLSDHDWTTQGILDVLLFFALGYVFMKMGLGEKITSARAATILLIAAIFAAASLFAWYALF